jgi:hypothetical protein
MTVIELIKSGVKVEAEDIAGALAMDDKEYRILLAEIAPEGVDEAAWLVAYSPALIGRTKYQLQVIGKGLKSGAIEATHRSEWVQWNESYGALRSAVDLRMRQAEAVSQERRQDHIEAAAGAARAKQERIGSSQRVAPYRTLAQRLTLAINEHRIAAIAVGLAPEPHDIALWGVLEELALPENDCGGPTLAEMVVSRRWRLADEPDVTS